MKLSRSFVIYTSILLGMFSCKMLGCRPRSPSHENEENKYLKDYRDIYYSYKKIPIDSTKARLQSYLYEFPENADAWAFDGNVYFKTGDYPKARVAYLRAINADRSKGIYYSSLGTVYGAENQIDSAERYLLKGVEMRDSSGYTLLNLAMIYKHKDDLNMARRFANAASQHTDSSAIVCAGLSYVYSALGDTLMRNRMEESAKRFGLNDMTALDSVLNGTMKIEDFYRQNY